MSWHRLDPEKTHKLLDTVRSSGEDLLFSQKNNEAKCMRLPFYTDFLLYRIENTASLPIFSMDFLGHDEDFFYLDGTDSALHVAQKNKQLSLRDDNIDAYIQFYFLNVIQEEGEIYALFDSPPLPDLINQNVHAVQKNIPAGTPEFHATKDSDGFTVSTPLFYDSALMNGHLKVSLDGNVTITALKPLLGQTMGDSFGDRV